jgi:hypothetical protein
MDERWKHVSDLFNAALERDPAGRARYLETACEDDPSLRAEVESLLAAHEKADAFLDRPAAVSAGLVPPRGSDDLKPGRTLGAYRIEREIGTGGMGLVFLAEDTRLARHVALKVLPTAMSGDETMRARLRQEARAAAALSHPSIATVFSYEEIDGRACLVTEYIRGETLRAEIARGPLDLDAVLDTGAQIARGLAAAHAAGIVHRDLKPENVVRGPRGEIKILDFGIARVDAPASAAEPRLTRAGDLLGTPGYMSPEQLEGADVDARSDIYALGVVLYELAAGRHPFEGTRPDSGAAPELPPQLDAIVRTCLERRRSDRYPSALDVAADLENLRVGRAVSARGSAAAGRTSLSWWRVHQAVRMVVVATLVYGVWRVHAVVHADWTLALFLAYVVTGALNGTLRAHLLFVSAVNPQDLDAEFRRARATIRGTDLLVSALLLLAAATVVRSQTLLPSILAAVAVGWAVTTLVIEPATCRAAFGRRTVTPAGASDRS